jgi:hypothetical protein
MEKLESLVFFYSIFKFLFVSSKSKVAITHLGMPLAILIKSLARAYTASIIAANFAVSKQHLR